MVLLCSSDWSWTHYPTVSAFQVLRSQVHITTLGWCSVSILSPLSFLPPSRVCLCVWERERACVWAHDACAGTDVMGPCRGQRTALWSQVPSYIFPWAQELELGLQALCSRQFLPLSHLEGLPPYISRQGLLLNYPILYVGGGDCNSGPHDHTASKSFLQLSFGHFHLPCFPVTQEWKPSCSGWRRARHPEPPSLSVVHPDTFTLALDLMWLGRILGGKGRWNLRPAWSTKRAPGHQDYTERLCLEKQTTNKQKR